MSDEEDVDEGIVDGVVVGVVDVTVLVVVVPPGVNFTNILRAAQIPKAQKSCLT